MKAWVQERFGTREAPVLREISEPQAGPGEVVIEVEAFAVNPVDWKILDKTAVARAMGLKVPRVPCMDVAGTVVELGDRGSDRLRTGDSVVVKLPVKQAGGAAQFVRTQADRVLLRPESVSAEQGAGLLLAGTTAYQALATHGRLRVGSGQRVLVIGASGGVGHLAVQMAKTWEAHVSGVCSTANVAFARSLGADEVFDHTLSTPSDWGTFDVVLDCVGLGWLGLRHAVALGGRYVTINPKGVDIVAHAATGLLGQANVRAMMLQDRVEDFQQVLDMAAHGELRVHVAASLPMDDLPEAWKRSQEGRTVGKLLVWPRR